MGITIDSGRMGIREIGGEISAPRKSNSARFAEALAQGGKSAAVAAAGIVGGPVGSAVMSKMITGTSNASIDHQGLMNQMQSRGMELLMLQTQIQQSAQYYTTQTNIMKTDHDARMSSIRNIKG